MKWKEARGSAGLSGVGGWKENRRAGSANVVTRNVRLVRKAALIISYPKLNFPRTPVKAALPLLRSLSPSFPRNYQAIQPASARITTRLATPHPIDARPLGLSRDIIFRCQHYRRNYFIGITE